MAKKKRNKPNLPPEALARARAQLEQADDSAPAAAKPKVEAKPVEKQNQAPRSFKKTMTRDELSDEYGYVLRDLSSMGILALILFVGMVAVSLGLNSVL